MQELIADGRATTIWHGITHDHLLAMCASATEDEAAAMSTAASLMMAGECTIDEWESGRRALVAVEGRLCAAWESEHGAPRLNRFGRIAGGTHPALDPQGYAMAIGQRRV